MMWHPDVIHAFLVDAGDSSKLGGTGRTFDWRTSRPEMENIKKIGRVIVAGGLTPGNVTAAVDVLRPWGVDVVSGVETMPGKKDLEKVRAFVKAVRDFDRKTS